MTIENKKKLSLEQVEKLLKKKMPDYDYKIINNVVLVSKNESVQLNVIVEDATIQTVEAVGFITKLGFALGVMATAFYFLQFYELKYWLQSIIYILAFLFGGVLGDLYHKGRYKKDYATFKPQIEGILMKANG